VNTDVSAEGGELGAADGAEAIVVIDDDYAIRLACRQTLAKTGYDVTTFEDGAAGLKGVGEIKPALVVVDLKMPGISGLEVIERVHDIDPDIVIIVITGYATIATAVDAMKAGAYDFLPKPFKPDELRMIVARGLERRNLLLASRRAEVERELMKRRFVTFVSHQLKTPLVAIHQYLDVMNRMESGEHPVEQKKEWLERCLNRTREMQEIIDDWLTLSKMEGGCLARESVAVELKGIVQTILCSYEGMAAQESVSLALDMPDDGYVVMGDRNCLSVLCDNLIVNAIKYNKPGGGVTVSGRRSGDEVTLSVADTGIGVCDGDLPFLFDEFFRGKRRGKTNASGTGLGLPICKRIVTELGGCIEVESEEGVGSVFRVRLPVSTTTGDGNKHVAETGAQRNGKDTGSGR
jgi:two-component system sensor histidine kinase/response regulator